MSYSGLQAEADDFSGTAIALISDKAGLVRHFFSWFPGLPRQLAALEYLDRATETRQEVI